MNARTFFEKVALMRQAQNEYFKTRSHEALTRSKALEAEIDREIERVRASGYQPQTPSKQLSLFSSAN